MIKLTVGLPMFRSKRIVWLPLEGLARQRDVDFDWELLVAEETEDAFGKDGILQYSDRLRKIGCKRIEYKSLSQWIPLAQKWRWMGQAASEGSRSFLLHGADDFSQPYRLKEAYEIFKNSNVDCAHATKVIYFDVATYETAIFDIALFNEESRLGLDNAIRTELMRTLPLSDRSSAVDHWIYESVQERKGAPLNIVVTDSPHWREGLHTQGLNIICTGRGYRMRMREAPFREFEEDIAELMAPEILNRLKKCRRFAGSSKVLRHIPVGVLRRMRKIKQLLVGNREQRTR